MPEKLITPVVSVSDEHLGSPDTGLVLTVDHMVFSDGTSVRWKSASIPAKGDDPGLHVEAYNVYEPDGKPIVDAARIRSHARALWVEALLDEALLQQRAELLPPISLVRD